MNPLMIQWCKHTLCIIRIYKNTDEKEVVWLGDILYGHTTDEGSSQLPKHLV